VESKNSSDNQQSKIQDEVYDENKYKYLLFTVGDELFGVPLMGVREVVEPQTIKPLPNTIEHFLGVINIRGEIVGVVDLRIRFLHEIKETPFLAMIIFESAVGPIAALVDRVESVSVIDDEDVDKNPNITSNFPIEYLIGIGKIKEKLVTLINLNKVLGVETLNKFRATRV
jgi:purine-binding chemotaxis protein CheW